LKSQRVVFTDLDGTLLDYETQAYEAALPALGELRRRNVPVIFCSSKTRAEVEMWRAELGNSHPFIVENGAAVFVPDGCFAFTLEGAVQRGEYEAIEFGASHAELVEALRAASRETSVRVRALDELTAEEVSQRYGVPLRLAILAKQREYDEAFEILDADQTGVLLGAIERCGNRWIRSDRFYHIAGKNDKATAVSYLSGLYRRVHGAISTVGLGDALNDAEFLNSVDLPILVRSHFARELQARVPRGRLTEHPGPQGWNQAILEILFPR
jgi:mannosyl-3-phosphoglycerate phosphatase